MTNVNTTNENKFYNFTASATCYINDIRVVSPKNGKKKDAFVSVKVAILEGEKSDPSKHFANFIVRGDQAKEIIRAYKDHWPEFGKQNGWFAGIQIGSLYAKTYEHKGETKVTLSGRLLKFTYLQIGDTVIDLKAFETQLAEQAASQPVQQAAPQPVQQTAPQPVQQTAPQPVQQTAPQPA